jgi:tetratricopeptide (TPR) repeat protein
MSMVGDGGSHTENVISGGIFNQPVVMARDITVTASPAPLAPAQLPARPEGFVGRNGDLATLADLLDPGTTRALVVSAVAGLAGVGKTALVIAAGHSAQEQGWYPGGILFIDLQGYDEKPVEMAQALDTLLRALGVSAEYIPIDVGSRAGLYRSRLAQIGEPVLIIVDDASSEAQVRPLLPGAPQHRVLITSRHTLAGLEARLVEIAALDTAASAALLDTAVRIARPDDDRISGDLRATARLTTVCGGLPLALQITAALLKADSVLTAAELAHELASERDRLARLQYDDGSGAGGLSVAAAFGLSYRRLDPDSAGMFRLLALDPGPDVSTTAAAVLADMPSGQAREILARLAQAHLIETVPGVAGRWRMHDLLRLYAQQRCDEDTDVAVRERARDRLLSHYANKAKTANQYVEALSDVEALSSAASGVFAGRADALAWFDAEQSNLIAAVSMAVETGRDQVAMWLPISLAAYLDLRRRLDDKLSIVAVSRDTAQRLGDRKGEAAALNTLGNTLAQLRRFDEAITMLRDAVAIFRETGDRQGEGMALGNIGNILAQLRRFDEAITMLRDAVAIFQEASDRNREGMALINIGIWYCEVNHAADALPVTEQALEIFRVSGDRHREGMALNNLGLVFRNLGRSEDAIASHEEAAAIYEETGDRPGEGTAVNNLGLAFRDADRFGEAVTAHQCAIAIFRETDDRHHEGTALHNLGLAFRGEGRIGEAIVALREAAVIFRDAGGRHDEGAALGALSLAFKDAGQFAEAIAALREAAAIYRETGDQRDEGAALSTLGLSLSEAGRFGEAVTVLQDAAATCQAARDREGEAMALGALSLVLFQMRRFKEAIVACQNAATIYRDIADRQGEGGALTLLASIRAAQQADGEREGTW